MADVGVEGRLGSPGGNAPLPAVAVRPRFEHCSAQAQDGGHGGFHGFGK
jgi:hypothetical protein